MPTVENETEAFGLVVKHPHGRVDPCFMTGKGCVYTEVIEHAIKTDRRPEALSIGDAYWTGGSTKKGSIPPSGC